MGDNPTRFLGIFAVVFFVLTLLSGAGFFGAIGATLVATVIVYFVMTWLAKKKAEKGPPAV